MAKSWLDITEQTAETARALGYEPESPYSPILPSVTQRATDQKYVRDAIKILEHRCVDFEFDGEMAADVALNKDVRSMYPFSRLKDNANVLVMPAIHSASISTKMLGELGGATVIGPMLIGMSKPVQIVRIGCTSSELLNMAAIAAYDF